MGADVSFRQNITESNENQISARRELNDTPIAVVNFGALESGEDKKLKKEITMSKIRKITKDVKGDLNTYFKLDGAV